MKSFADLLNEYTERTGISDADLARTLGVRRQTIFRWKEGAVTHPRHADDVMRCAARLRLTPAERDLLLGAAGFAPLGAPSTPATGLDPNLPPSASLSQAAPSSLRSVKRARLAWAGVAALILIAAGLAAAVWLRYLSYPAAKEGENLVLVAPFTNYVGGEQGYNVAGRIQSALSREFEAARMPGARVSVWPRIIPDSEAAQKALARSGAVMVVWGEYDSGRVLAHFSVPGTHPEVDSQQVEMRLASPQDLPATINAGLPEEVRYSALLALAHVYVEQRDSGRARAALTQALSRPPADADEQASAYFLLAYIAQLDAPADLDQAIAYYSQAIALEGNMVSAYNNRAAAYLSRGQAGDAQRAADDLSRVIDVSPGDVAAHYNRGLAYVKLGDKDGWQEDFAQVLELDASHTGAQNALCWAYVLEQEAQAALPYCERAVTLDPTGLSRDSRGIAYAQVGRTGEAIADFEAYLVWLASQPAEVRERYGPVRQGWIDALRAEHNPFDAAALAALRNE